MRLLFVIQSMAGGGAERVTANLANYWTGKGWDISVVTFAPRSMDCYELHASIKRIDLGLTGNSGNILIGLWQNVRRLFALRRVLRQIQPDIALGMMTGANVLLAIASSGLPQVKTVGSERTYPPQYPLGGVWEWLRRHSYSKLDVVVAQTNEGAEWLKSNTGAQRVGVIPNPVNWPLVNQPPFIDAGNICGKGRRILLAVGRLSSEKQFGLLVDCFQSLASRHSDWDLVILGEGSLRSELETQAREGGMANRIFLPGRAGNIGEWYSSADLYVMSSRFEGFPNTLVEAMAYGMPVVSFDCDTGPRDIIRHKMDGMLVSPGNAAAFTAALDQLMGDDSLRRELSERALDVRERFATERIANDWEVMFEEVRT